MNEICGTSMLAASNDKPEGKKSNRESRGLYKYGQVRVRTKVKTGTQEAGATLCNERAEYNRRGGGGR